MAANPAIFNALMQAPRSVEDYRNDYAQRDIQQQNLQRNALLLQEGQALQQDRVRTRADADTLRNALQVLGPDATDEQRIRAAKATGLPIGYTQADALEKAILERQKTLSGVNKDDAETATKQYELKRKALEHGIQWLQTAQNPQQAQQMFADGVRKGHWSMQDAQRQAQGIPQDPAQFTQWRVGQLAQILAAKDQLPKLETRNTGGTTDTLAIDPLTGIPRVTGSVNNTRSPDNIATVSASLENARAVRDAAKETGAATRDAANTKRDQDTEMKLADDYRAQSKDFIASKSAFEQLNSTLASATTSPAATLAAATKFMKILDPGSVVRESELGMALAASGVIDRAMNYINILQRGKVLTPTQAADFKNVSGQMFQAAQGVQKAIDADYQAKAKAYKLRPEMVTQDLGQNAKTVNWGDLK